MINKWAALDIPLICLVWYLVFNGPEFIGGFGWFLLLGLSPNAWKSNF